jgi:hypothetical protein
LRLLLGLAQQVLGPLPRRSMQRELAPPRLLQASPPQRRRLQCLAL